MRNPYVLACGITATPGVVHGPTVGNWGDFEMFMYEFVGDLSRYDDSGLLSEDGELVASGYSATELLTRALLEFRSMPPAEQVEVLKLLKHIFDPRGTVFCGRSFTYKWFANERFRERGERGGVWNGPALVFMRYASTAADEHRYTKLMLKFRAEHDRSLEVQCFTYEALAPQADVRAT
jgi:hypothetical protein